MKTRWTRGATSVGTTRRRLVGTGLIAIALLGAACSAPPSPSTAGTGSTQSATSALQPLDQAALEAAFGNGVKETKAPGGVAIVTTPQGPFTVRYGTGEVGADKPIQAKDHFRIGSTTKTMVGAVILQLAQEGALKLDDPVSKYRPGVPNGDKITIEQLLNMRSGLASYTDNPELGAAVDRDPTRAWRPDELLALAFAQPPHNAPDAAFYYSNTNTVLLGLIAEQLDRKPLDEVLHDRLFGPLGMNDTFLPATTSNEIPNPHTRGYLYGTNAIFLRIDTSLPPEMQAQLDAGTLPLNDVTDENPSWGWAAGAAISTADDMVTWINALVDGKVLDAEYQKRWLDKGQPTDPNLPDGIRYGLAHYSIATPDGSTLYGHSGEIPGFNTWMLRDPKNDVTIVGWANLAPNHGDEAYISQLIGQIYKPAPTTTTPAGQTNDFAGLVDIGNGRKIYATCRGTGSPTVVLIAGKGNGAADWQQVLAPSDPARTAPGDDVAAGQGTLVPSKDAVFDSTARFTRVCSYDRPDVRIDGAEISTPRPQPHTVDLDVSDLHALLGALGEPGPYVMVAHSYGGFIAALYARTYPQSIAGLVMVDGASELIAGVVSKAKLDSWDATNAMTSPQSREGVKVIDAINRINAAGPLPNVPAAVLSSDKPWRTDLLPPDAKVAETVTFDDWLESQNRLTTALQAKRVTKTDSGHDIELYSPALVIAAIRDVVDRSRVATNVHETAGPLDPAARSRLDAAFQEGFDRSGAAGATLGLWIPGRGEWVASRGVADRATGTPLERAMQAPIGSVTKTYTVLVALQLAGEGALTLDDTIDRWYPNYPEANKITLRMLMNHSSGINDISEAQIHIKCATPEREIDPDQLINISATVSHAPFTPGNGYEYSSANTIILGRILEKVTGLRYEQLLDQWLFQPLGLSRTRLDSDGRLQAPSSHGYTDFCTPTRPPGTDTSTWTMIAFAGGALASTIDDLHTYGVAFGTGYGLNEQLRQARLADTAPGGPSSGLGLVQEHDASNQLVSIGHAGSEPGYGTNLLYFPCTGAVFAAMVTADFAPAMAEILRAVQPDAQQLATTGCTTPTPR